MLARLIVDGMDSYEESTPQGLEKGNGDIFLEITPLTFKVGTPLIFEVRGHDIDVNLKDGEKMARLTFYRMSEDAEHEQGKVGDYKEQTLKLSNLFAEWPSSSPAGSKVGSSSAENDKEAA